MNVTGAPEERHVLVATAGLRPERHGERATLVPSIGGRIGDAEATFERRSERPTLIGRANR